MAEATRPATTQRLRVQVAAPRLSPPDRVLSAGRQLRASLRGEKMIAQSDRLPPTDRAAEHALIGAMLIEPSIVGKVVDEITTHAMFTSVENATVFRAILESWSDNQHFDGLTIGSKLEGHANHRALIAHLEHCMNQTPSAAGWDAYARLVRNAYQLRELLRVNHDLSESAYDRTKDPDEAIDAALARLRGLRQRKERVQSLSLIHI